MWALIAECDEVYQDKIGEPFLSHLYEEVVALFSTKEKAEQYEKESRLKKVQKRSFASDKVYKSNSLLSEAESARIEDWTEPEYPVDPHI